MRAVRSFLSAGEIGPIRALAGWYTNGTLHNGTHWFDLLRMLCGQVDWVEARDVLREGGTDPTVDVRLGLASGAEALLRGWDAAAYSLFEMEILAERGRIAITDSGHCVTVERAEASRRYSGYTELRLERHDFGDRRDLMLAAVDDLATAIREGRQPLSSGEDGLAALRIGTAALIAAKRACRMNLPSAPLP
jgi:predicted dehydrogenase